MKYLYEICGTRMFKHKVLEETDEYWVLDYSLVSINNIEVKKKGNKDYIADFCEAKEVMIKFLRDVIDTNEALMKPYLDKITAAKVGMDAINDGQETEVIHQIFDQGRLLMVNDW